MGTFPDEFANYYHLDRLVKRRKQQLRPFGPRGTVTGSLGDKSFERRLRLVFNIKCITLCTM